MLGITLASTAQITINRSDLGTLINKSFISADDSTNLNLLSPGNAGASQTWNLTGIGNDYKDTIPFISPAGTACFSNFPTATLAEKVGSMYAYVLDNSTVMEMLGFCGIFMPPNTTIVKYTPPEKKITFPSTYNTYFTSQTKYALSFPISNYPPYDSSKSVTHISDISLIDGWGNVTTPTGTYASLRQKLITYQTDSSFIHSSTSGLWTLSGTPTNDTTIDYSWCSQNNVFIADITTKWNGQIKSATYWLSTTTGINEVKDDDQLSIYPNPSNGEFTMVSGDNGHLDLNKIEIFNTLGEKVYSNQAPTIQSLNLHLNLPKGMYFVELSKEHSMQTKKIIIQ
jgi:hypothetical protein